MADLSRKRILVVDDTVANLDILVDTLGETYRVIVATDGVQALSAVKREKPDLILLDILMPEMDGYEVCTRLRQDPETRDILIIFVTSLADAVDETRGFELGAVDYITKPFSASVVMARVKTHLELAEARNELTRQNELLKENIELREQVEQVTRHDLKNPLQIILTSAQLLHSGGLLDPDDIVDITGDQVNAAYTMLNMINRSLDLYKMEKGCYHLEKENTDLIPMLERILTGNKHLMAQKGLGASVYINNIRIRAGERFEVPCDPLLFYTMMSNLILNALEASPEGRSVDIRLSDGDEIQICVENHGAVPPEIRETFFDKLVTHGKLNGTGLGTYSARLTAESHGGRIEMDTSDEADKTRVTLFF